MDVKITNKEEQPLLSATKVTADITYEKATPSRKDISDALAKQLNAKPEMVSIRTISAEYGFGKATATAMAYTDKNVMDTVEQEWLSKRGKKEAKEGEAPAEEKKAEKPPEASKEEKKEEKKETPKEDAPKDEKKGE